MRILLVQNAELGYEYVYRYVSSFPPGIIKIMFILDSKKEAAINQRLCHFAT